MKNELSRLKRLHSLVLAWQSDINSLSHRISDIAQDMDYVLTELEVCKDNITNDKEEKFHGCLDRYSGLYDDCECDELPEPKKSDG